jgi:hypothetical protein
MKTDWFDTEHSEYDAETHLGQIISGWRKGIICSNTTIEMLRLAGFSDAAQIIILANRYDLNASLDN